MRSPLSTVKSMSRYGLPLTLCWQLANVSPAMSQAQDRRALEQGLQAIVEEVLAADRRNPGVLLHVDAPRLDLSWSGAAGFASVDPRQPLSPQDPVRIASNTKTFVAAAILRLVESERLELDEPIDRHLSDDSLAELRRGGYDPGAITLRHLLTHTSGLFDYASSRTYGELVSRNPHRRWSRLEQLHGAMTWGKPHGPPGEVYGYADTGYILLGEILERETSQPLAAALRQLVGYSRLGLESTWLESLEPRPEGARERAHQYIDWLDTWDWDPSCDLYGGGGLVSTVGDLARFWRALFTGGVYDKPETSETMLTTVAATRMIADPYETATTPGAYRMAVLVDEVDGTTVYLHTGSWGTLAAYVPSLDLAVAAAVTQQLSRQKRRLLLRRALGLVRDASPPASAP